MNHCKSELAANRLRAEQGSAWIPALLVLLSAIALAAAVWQWQRSAYHQALAAQAKTQQASAQHLDLNATLASMPRSAVQVQGQWLDNSTVFVAPRIHAAKAGAWVVSVLRYSVQGQTRHIAVHRGWILQKNVLEKPVLDSLPKETVVLHGQSVPTLGRSYELGAPKYTELGLWQNHDLAAHSKLLGVQLDDAVLVLSPASPDAEANTLQRDNPANAEQQWQEKADKNLGYAVQWLGLGLVGLFGLLWMLRKHRATLR
jgi:cytochrome oxidase assembly protein ShyY1